MKNKIFFYLVLFFIFGVILYFNNNQNTKSAYITTNQAPVLGQRTKDSNCQINGPLPDKLCTPGAIFLNTTSEQICVKGYSSKARDVSVETKKQVYEEYGIYTHKTGEYEVDHLISLELGGSNDITNLWPEAANPSPGFHEKDKLENFLHNEVCNGYISLKDAQQMISSDWLGTYKKYLIGK